MINPIIVKQDVEAWLAEDMPFWDVSLGEMEQHPVSGKIIAKSKGMVAGIPVAVQIFEALGVEITDQISEGGRVEPGDMVMSIHGKSSSILQGERVALNILCHLSAIATKTADLVSKCNALDLTTRIAATRKTLPGLRRYQKYAVMIGGGDTHRLDLSSMVLIKENHVATFGGITEAVAGVKDSISFSHKIEIEVRTDEEALEAAKAGVDIIMLDNYTPERIRPLLPRLREVDHKILIEASGGITAANVMDYARVGVDIISLGALTHSVSVFDMSLLLDSVERI